METVCLLFPEFWFKFLCVELRMRGLLSAIWMQLKITTARNFSNWLDSSPLFPCSSYKSLMCSPFAHSEIDVHLNDTF